ncbi:hypothetical protein RFI_05370 [Reticulomyxa filosa]|uniref:Uncharacterized protein n=1 Tax=Reticulomyxa filosa TaxID=46433 RepID=X6P0Z0_RETFI|nr:hypothetical protein RFI_05370 [Reticulomyxa filosa]|eukprot:ETO31749.1 hypothetical protein RFI_05370 [Reticulomyxa filosa]
MEKLKQISTFFLSFSTIYNEIFYSCECRYRPKKISKTIFGIVSSVLHSISAFFFINIVKCSQQYVCVCRLRRYTSFGVNKRSIFFHTFCKHKKSFLTAQKKNKKFLAFTQNDRKEEKNNRTQNIQTLFPNKNHSRPFIRRKIIKKKQKEKKTKENVKGEKKAKRGKNKEKNVIPVGL